MPNNDDALKKLLDENTGSKPLDGGIVKNNYLGTLPLDARIKAEGFLSTNKFNQLLDAVWKRTKEVAQKSNGITPMIDLVMFHPDGSGELGHGICALQELDPETKHQMLFNLGGFSAKEGHRIVAAFQIAEAWMNGIDLAKGEKWDGKTRPSQDPNRKEVLICTGLTLDGRNNGIVQPIKTAPGKKVEFTGEPITTYCRELITSEGEKRDDKSVFNNLLAEYFKGYLTYLKLAIDGRLDEIDKYFPHGLKIQKFDP